MRGGVAAGRDQSEEHKVHQKECHDIHHAGDRPEPKGHLDLRGQVHIGCRQGAARKQTLDDEAGSGERAALTSLTAAWNQSFGDVSPV